MKIDKIVNRTYENLVESVRKSYLANDRDPSSQTHLEWCSQGDKELECKEINLWTYWQGRNHTQVKILVVGQDWGCVTAAVSAPYIENIKLMNAGSTIEYLHDVKKGFVTDKNLCKLFKVFEEYSDIEHKLYSDLFFTNYILGYRDKGTSGSTKRAWFEKDRQYFYDLVMLLRPRVIICLGKVVYEEVRSTFEDAKYRLPARNFWEKLDLGDNYKQYVFDNDFKMTVFGVAHCGGMGTANRKIYSKYTKSSGICGAELQRQDWMRIDEYMKKEGI